MKVKKITNNFYLPETIVAEIEKCNQCGKCLAVCPTYWVTADECDSARGLLELIRNVHSGKLAASEKYLTHLYGCLSCRACTEVCPSNIAINDVFDFVKEKVVHRFVGARHALPKTGLYNPELWKKYLIKRLPIKKPNPQYLSSIPAQFKSRNTKNRIGFFVGCLMDVGYQRTAESIVDWLVAHHYEVIIPKEQGCCGMPAFTLGDINSAQELVKKNIEVFKDEGIKTIVTGCAHCAYMIKNKWEAIIEKFPFKILHIAEVISEFHPPQMHKMNRQKRIGYQPACFLHRGLSVSTNLEQLLGKPIPNYVEVKNAVTCCGQAGINGFLFPKISTEIVSRQMDRYTKLGLDILLTNCPWCNLIYDKQKLTQFKSVSLCEYIPGEKIE
ncbi:MAG: (Fe-S)-binding protein [bacterium]|nr:(Fe-S)-binding protein [bacterium]